jgi:hypothetical protein
MVGQIRFNADFLRSAMELRYLCQREHQFGRVNLGRATAAGALKKAKGLLEEGYMDVRICTPRGQVLRSDEFDQLDG